MMPELLAPAGNFEKMRAAIRYGADAVYLSGKMFGMRATADNFSAEELMEAVSYAHARGVRVYLAVNVMPHENEYPSLLRFLSEIKGVPLDAVILADMGVLALVRENLPDMTIHISTQANVLSAAACRTYYALGAKRVILGREASLEEIRQIRQSIPADLELEAFIHGSMCISHSGRCLLSSHFTRRDANRGMCTQPCRWHYKIRETSYEIVEEKRPDEPIPVCEVDGETFFMSSRDTCMIEHIPALMEAGIDSFKIEGRMRSAYYAAVVTNTYRMAMDAYAKGGYRYDPGWLRELESVSHRPYHTGYFFDDPRENANVTEFPGYLHEKAYLARVVSYDPKTQQALLCQQNKFCLHDTVELLCPGQVGLAFKAEELYDAEHAPITAVPHPQMYFYMKMPFAAEEGDILRAAGRRDL